MPKMIFVFGSNEAGIHGAGAAKTAYEKYGARWGFSYGHMNHSFAIPTKDQDIQTLSLQRIEMYVQGFMAYAAGHPKQIFQVTRLGCGLAGLKDEQIASMFKGATKNCLFDEVWKPFLHEGTEFWGTYP